MAPTADHPRSSSGEELDSGCRLYICMTLQPQIVGTMKARCFTEPTELYIFIGSAQGQLLLIVDAYHQSPLPFPIQVWYDTPAIHSDVLCTYMSRLVFICVEVSFVSQFQFHHSMTLECTVINPILPFVPCYAQSFQYCASLISQGPHSRRLITNSSTNAYACLL